MLESYNSMALWYIFSPLVNKYNMFAIFLMFSFYFWHFITVQTQITVTERVQFLFLAFNTLMEYMAVTQNISKASK